MVSLARNGETFGACTGRGCTALAANADYPHIIGVPQRLILDNFPAAVAGTDRLAPRPTVGFLEYSQARGFLVDPARVRHPRDKPRVERFIAYVQRRFWHGGTFVDLADVRAQAEN